MSPASAWADELDVDDSDILRSFNNSHNNNVSSSSSSRPSSYGDGLPAPTHPFHDPTLPQQQQQQQQQQQRQQQSYLHPSASSSAETSQRKLHVSSSSASDVLQRFQKRPSLSPYLLQKDDNAVKSGTEDQRHLHQSPPLSTSSLVAEVNNDVAGRKRSKEYTPSAKSPLLEVVHNDVANRKRVKEHPFPYQTSSSSLSLREHVNGDARRKLTRGHHPSQFHESSTREYKSDIENADSRCQRRNLPSETENVLRNKEKYTFASVDGCVTNKLPFGNIVWDLEKEDGMDIHEVGASNERRSPLKTGHEEDEHGLQSIICKDNRILLSVVDPRYAHTIEEQEEEIPTHDNGIDKSFPARKSWKHILKQVSGKDHCHETGSSLLQKENNVFCERVSSSSTWSAEAGMPDKGILTSAEKLKFQSDQTTLPLAKENQKLSGSRDGSASDSPKKGLPYTIPGPAGALQKGVMQKVHTHCVRTKENCGQGRYIAEDSDFQTTPWINAINYVKKSSSPSSSAYISAISSVKTCRTENRIPKLVVVIKSCLPNGCGDMMVTLKDQTDCIAGTVNRRVMSETEFGRLIEPGAVMLLHQVAVFSPTPYAHYLNITINNVEQVFGKSQGFLCEDEAPGASNEDLAIKGSKHGMCVNNESSQLEVRMVDLCTQTAEGKKMGNEVATKAIGSAPEADAYDQLLDDSDILQCLQLRSAVPW